MGAKWVIATRNPGKAADLAALLEPHVEAFQLAGDLDLPDVDETAETFADNARLKAIAAAKHTDLVALADDSGFCVDALGGEPGIHTGRWAGSERNLDDVASQVLTELAKRGLPSDSPARYVCALCVAGHQRDSEMSRVFVGTVEAHLTEPLKHATTARALAFESLLISGTLDR